jgi:hypothetical protein
MKTTNYPGIDYGLGRTSSCGANRALMLPIIPVPKTGVAATEHTKTNAPELADLTTKL